MIHFGVFIMPGSVLALIILVHYIWGRYTFHKKYRLPSVIPGWPIIGNTFDIPFPAGMFGVEKARQYGEMYTCYFGGRANVYLNSSRVVYDLLEKRAAIYSSRQPRPMAQDIMSGGARMLLMPYSDRWKNQRKIMHSVLNLNQAENRFRSYQELECKQLVYDFLTGPENFHLACQRFSNSIIMSVIFGRRTELHDHGLKEILDSFEAQQQMMFDPIKNLCDSFPWLINLPKSMQWWRRTGEEYFRKTRALYKREHDLLLQKMKNGTARPCFAVDVEQGTAKKYFEVDETEKLFIYSTLLEAGSDTSRVAITQVVAAMAVYPAWVAKARAMLDDTCGHNAERLPCFEDKEQLPYIMAAVKESLRWRPFIQTGMPHMLVQDDEYEGYKFPAGTVFSWNAYAIALNESDYDNPMVFSPERFMNQDLNNPFKGPWAFGAGRRVCPGYKVGLDNVWIAIACLIYCFDITEDPNQPIDTLYTFWDEHHKAPFHPLIKPRSDAHIDLIKRVGADALAVGY